MMWKNFSMASFKASFQYFLRWTEEIHENKQNSRSRGEIGSEKYKNLEQKL
jgi:predicted transposase YbfD/YdcC